MVNADIETPMPSLLKFDVRIFFLCPGESIQSETAISAIDSDDHNAIEEPFTMWMFSPIPE